MKTKHTENRGRKCIRSVALRVQTYRLAAALTLLCSSVLFTYFTYRMLWQGENRAYEVHYESIATELLQGIDLGLERLSYASYSMSTSAGLTYPDSSTWPNASINGFSALNNNIFGLTNARVTLTPIVLPEDVSSFEAYAAEAFAADPDIPEDAGISDFGFGIFSLDDDGNRYHDTTGETAFSENTYLTPILGSAFPATTKAFLFNTHSEPVRAEAMDASYACALSGEQDCSTLSDIIQHISQAQYNPTSLLYVPIFSYNDNMLVGFSLVGFTWVSALQDVLSEVIDGIECVIATSTHQYTISVTKGVTRLKGPGDLHDKKYDRYRRVTEVALATQVTNSAVYTAKVYPTATLYNNFHSNKPIIATTSCLALVLLTMTVFMLYDHVIKKESDKKDLVLEHKRQFVRFVSHEIRTPLNAVKLGLLYLDEVMRDEVAADHGVDGGRCGMNEREYLKHTSDILQSTDVAVAVLDDFLQYDKIQAGQLTLESKPFVLCEVIQDNIKLFLLPAAELRIRIVFIHETPDDKCQPDPNGHVVSECRHCDRLHVVGDHVRMAQVFRNLMSNALKFSAPESTVVVKVTTSTYGLPGVEVVAEDGSRAIPAGSMTVSVTDTGPGLSAENLERLFGEGVQFNPNDLQGGNGSGLGLWISKGIVDMHRGKIWASSTGEGSGCTFFVELPVVKHLSFVATTQPETKLIDEQRGKSTDDKCLRNAPFRQHQRIAPEVSANAPLTGSEADDCARRESRRVLVVDDTESNRKIVRRLLHRRGYCTVEACNGLEAVNIMKSLLPDDVGFVCILMDFEMPVMKGPEATSLIRELGFHDTKIFGLTGNVLENDRAIFTSAGADVVLGKPLDMMMFDSLMSN